MKINKLSFGKNPYLTFFVSYFMVVHNENGYSGGLLGCFFGARSATNKTPQKPDGQADVVRFNVFYSSDLVMNGSLPANTIGTLIIRSSGILLASNSL